MISPITGIEMKLVKERAKLSFRKEEFEIVFHHFYCKDSKEYFTNDELDDMNLIQVHNQYREKYGIPFPQAIKTIREKYKVKPGKMSEILGFGPNSYRLYEAGEMPSVSNGRLILSISQPEEFIRQVEASSHILSGKDVNNYIDIAKELDTKEKNEWWVKIFETQIFHSNIPNEYSGYRAPDFEKISQTIAYFSDKLELYKTKLNKLLFYSDFLLYKRTGYSLTGIKYKAIPYGPVPAEYEKLYLKLQDDHKINIVEVAFDNGNYGEIIRASEKFNLGYFSEVEIATLDTIANRFKGMTTKQIVDISHKELAWKENNDAKKEISYQKYAYDLIAV